MDSDWKKEQRDLYEAVLAFCKDNLQDDVAEAFVDLDETDDEEKPELFSETQ